MPDDTTNPGCPYILIRIVGGRVASTVSHAIMEASYALYYYSITMTTRVRVCFDACAEPGPPLLAGHAFHVGHIRIVWRGITYRGGHTCFSLHVLKMVHRQAETLF